MANNIRASQDVLEVAYAPTNNMRVSQDVLEVAYVATNNLRISQAVLEVFVRIPRTFAYFEDGLLSKKGEF